jgi:hypothetical protein
VAGVPHSGATRTDSLSNSAGQAALAALRMHSSPPPPPPPARASSLTARQASSFRTNSLSNANRTSLLTSGALKTYVYHPKASYVTGQPLHAPPAPRQPARANSLSSRRTPSRSHSMNSQTRRPQSHAPALPPLTYSTLHEDDGETETVVTTRTTKVVDALGRTQSITVETVRTLPDGSNIIETHTKNILRSGLRANLLTAALPAYRAGSLLSQEYNLTKIDEDLRDFDYSYQEDKENARRDARNTRDVRDERDARDGALPAALRVLEEPQLAAADAETKPLRSILKNSAKAWQEQLEEPHALPEQPEGPRAPQESLPSPRPLQQQPPQESTQEAPPQPPSSRQDEADEEEFLDAMESLDKRKSFIEPALIVEPSHAASHPYHDLLLQGAVAPPTLQPSPVLTTTRKFAESSLPPPKVTSSASSVSGSIKFLDKVETIPIYNTYKPHAAPAVPAAPAASAVPKVISEEEMYERALEAARVKVYGDSAVANGSAPAPAPSRRLSATSNLSSSLDEARRNKKRNLPTSPQQEQIERMQQDKPHLNAEEVVVGEGVKDDYHYQNHHRDFSRHSMRAGAITPETKRKDRVKEEKKLLKLKAKEEKDAKKQAERESTEAKKQATAEAKRSKPKGLRFFRKKDKAAGGAASIASSGGQGSPEGTPRHNHSATLTDSIDETPISAAASGERDWRDTRPNGALAVSLPLSVGRTPPGYTKPREHATLDPDAERHPTPRAPEQVTREPPFVAGAPSDSPATNLDVAGAREAPIVVGPTESPIDEVDPLAPRIAGSESKDLAVEEYQPELEEQWREPLPHPSVVDVSSIRSSISEKIENGRTASPEDLQDEEAIDEFTKKLRAAASTVKGDDADTTVESTDHEPSPHAVLNGPAPQRSAPKPASRGPLMQSPVAAPTPAVTVLDGDVQAADGGDTESKATRTSHKKGKLKHKLLKYFVNTYED